MVKLCIVFEYLLLDIFFVFSYRRGFHFCLDTKTPSDRLGASRAGKQKGQENIILPTNTGPGHIFWSSLLS